MEKALKFWKNAQAEFPNLLEISLNIIAALLILLVGWIIASWIRNRIRNSKIGARFQGGATLRPVMASAVFYFIFGMSLYAFLMKLGVPATSLLAVFGAAGLAIGLALKDTLSNIASGVMLLALRPLSVGEFVDTGNAVGTIVEIGLFATTLKNTEGVFIYIPNSEVWKNRIQNFGRHKSRKAIIDIGVGYGSDLDAVKARLLELLGNTPDVQELPTPPEVYVMSFGDSAINLSCRCWLPGDNWLARTSDLRINIKKLLDSDGVEIPFPQRVIHTKAV